MGGAEVDGAGASTLTRMGSQRGHATVPSGALTINPPQARHFAPHGSQPAAMSPSGTAGGAGFAAAATPVVQGFWFGLSKPKPFVLLASHPVSASVLVWFAVGFRVGFRVGF